VPVDAVVFDWGGTLTPWHTIDLAECWHACGLGDDAAARLRAAEAAAWERARTSQHSGTLDEVFAAAEVTPTAAALAAYWAWWEEHTLTDPDVPGLFAGLRERGIRIGVLSNTLWPRVEHERVFRRDGVLDLIDAAVYTSEIRWTKPHPEAFRAALAALGVADPARAVFVGDRPWDDIHGARQVGMRAVLVPHSDIPDYQRGPVDGEPDAVVHRLADLLELVDRWRGAGAPGLSRPGTGR
jgi:putative hydrolase of the HAD superfamily